MVLSRSMKTSSLLLAIGLGLFSQSLLGTEKVALKPAPEFTLKDLEGKDFVFSKQTLGKVVIVDFWASWCPPCVKEVPILQSHYLKYKKRGLLVVGISMDEGGASDIVPFINKYRVTYPVVLGNGKVTADYGGIRGFPTTFIINKKGMIVHKLSGFISAAAFTKEIESLLAEK